jgi:hypothetical protein
MLHHTGVTTKPIQHIDSTINVGTATVQLIAQPKNTYVLIRVVNHWINNLLEFYDGDKDINKNQTWYIKWSSKYSHIRSSKRSLYDVYRALSENGNIDETDVTMYTLVTWLKDNIPEFVKHYDIKEQEENKNNMNHFTFSLSLFYSPYDDPNNRFSDYASQNDKFIPYTANKSIATKNTDVSRAGTSIVSEELQDIDKEPNIPKTVDLNVNPNNDDDDLMAIENNNQKISGDTNLSYSPAAATTDNSDTLHPSTKRQRKKTEDIKQNISNTCKNEIKSELQSFKDELHKSMSSYTDNITKMFNTTDKPDDVKSIPVPMIPPTYRQSMPSPNPRKPDEQLPTSYKYDQMQTLQTSEQYATKFHHMPYQKHNALSFSHFPESLQLRNLPATIMSYYMEDNKKSLFPTMDTVATIRKAIF